MCFTAANLRAQSFPLIVSASKIPHWLESNTFCWWLSSYGYACFVETVHILDLNQALTNDCVGSTGAVRSCCSYCPSMSLVPYGRSFSPPWRSVSPGLLAEYFFFLRPIFAVLSNDKLFSNENAFGLTPHWSCKTYEVKSWRMNTEI